METSLVELVWSRANTRCEYCHMPQSHSIFKHEIDHIIAIKHNGQAVADNLALACLDCNGYKGPNISGIDPINKTMVRLFNPRHDNWQEHFVWNGSELIGLTEVGRATISVLRINHPERVALREQFAAEDPQWMH
jgi:hypothetical protein